MITFDLLAYIKRERNKGVLVDEITKSLISNGWAITDIVSAYRQLKIQVPIDIDIKISNLNLQNERESEELVPLAPYIYTAKKRSGISAILKVIILILFLAVSTIIFLKFIR